MKYWYPAEDADVFAAGVATHRDLEALRAAGFEVCRSRNGCDVHPSEPEACYLCM